MQHTTPYRAIADATRRFILDLLRDEGPMRASDIVGRLSHISQPAVSKHLRILREAELVWVEPEGRERRYHLTPDHLLQIAEWLRHYEPLWERRLAALKHLVEQEQREQED